MNHALALVNVFTAGILAGILGIAPAQRSNVPGFVWALVVM